MVEIDYQSMVGFEEKHNKVPTLNRKWSKRTRLQVLLFSLAITTLMVNPIMFYSKKNNTYVQLELQPRSALRDVPKPRGDEERIQHIGDDESETAENLADELSEDADDEVAGDDDVAGDDVTDTDGDEDKDDTASDAPKSATRDGSLQSLDEEAAKYGAGTLWGTDDAPSYGGGDRKEFNGAASVVFAKDTWYAAYTTFTPGWGEPWHLQGTIALAMSADARMPSLPWRRPGKARRGAEGAFARAMPSVEWCNGRVYGPGLYVDPPIIDGTPPRYYVYHTCTSASHPRVERLSLSVSADGGVTWSKMPYAAVPVASGARGGFVKALTPVVEANGDLYDTRFNINNRQEHVRFPEYVQWHDPHIVRTFEVPPHVVDASGRVEADPEREYFYMFLGAASASIRHRCRAVIAVASSTSPTGPWHLHSPVLTPLLPPEDAGPARREEGLFHTLRRPHVIYRHGRWHLFASTDPHTINPRWRAPQSASSAQGTRGGQFATRLFHWTSKTRSILGPYEANLEMYPNGYNGVLGSEHTGLFWTMLVTRLPWRPFTNSTEESEMAYLRAERRRWKMERKQQRREEASQLAAELAAERKEAGLPESQMTEDTDEQLETEVQAAVAVGDPTVLADLEEVGRARGSKWRRRRLLARREKLVDARDAAIAADLVDRVQGAKTDDPIFAIGAYRLGDAEGKSRDVRLRVHGTLELSGRWSLLWPSGGVPPQIVGTPPFGSSLAEQAAAYRDLTSEV